VWAITIYCGFYCSPNVYVHSGFLNALYFEAVKTKVALETLHWILDTLYLVLPAYVSSAGQALREERQKMKNILCSKTGN
jgi:hypothetical protein